MKKIPLTKGQAAIVDDEDFEELSQHSWHSKRSCTREEKYYATRSMKLIGKYRPWVMMHQQIMGDLEGFEIDHVDGNTLDNRRCNLRFATRSQNCQNRKKLKNTVSKYRGVYRSRSKSKPWKTQLSVNTNSIPKNIHIGYYETEMEAAIAYDIEALKRYGEFANPNILKPEDVRG